jgi:hypothetical protein
MKVHQLAAAVVGIRKFKLQLRALENLSRLSPVRVEAVEISSERMAAAALLQEIHIGAQAVAVCQEFSLVMGLIIQL